MQLKRNNKIIGVVLEDIVSDFSKELVRSVANALPENGPYRLAVLPGRYDDNAIGSKALGYKGVYNTVFRLSDVCDIDGLIIHLGSLHERERGKIDRFKAMFRHFDDIPKVFIASDLEENTNVNYDNEAGIREAVDCLVNVNGLTKLCMLGGRDDNKDAIIRKNIFKRCLEESGVSFEERRFACTDMSIECEREAAELLHNNPDAQAIFCVNDAVAVGLYKAMEKRDLTPGRDILVFGFDNTRMSSELVPPLTSIGAASVTLGQKAVELLIAKMNGETVTSALVPTRLYGRESLPYEMYDYSRAELVNIEPAFVYRMFDDCFYRYRLEHISREQVNLRRLFYEFISRMLFTIKRRYMSVETFNELGGLIDIFFKSGAMQYTDAQKMLSCIERLQVGMNNAQRSFATNVMINRLFLRMKDRAILAISGQRTKDLTGTLNERSMHLDLMIAAASAQNADSIYRSLDKIGLQNAALFVFDEPYVCQSGSLAPLPEQIMLKSVVRSGELYLPVPERQRTLLHELFIRDDFFTESCGCMVFPILGGCKIYGLLLCDLTDDIYDKGELVAVQIGRSLQLYELNNGLS